MLRSDPWPNAPLHISPLLMIILPKQIGLINGKRADMKGTEKQIEIPTSDGESLDGRLISNGQSRHAVICHPHPLYGGNMDNNVVVAARDALIDLEFGTLRFNFRGVGASSGRFGDGDGEAIDIAAACQYLADNFSAEIHAVAYSFGSFAFLKAVERGLKVKSAALLSPPATFMDLSAWTLPRTPCLVVAGDADQYCNLLDLEDWLDNQPKSDFELRKVVIPNTDHFYWGSEKELQKELSEFFVNLQQH